MLAEHRPDAADHAGHVGVEQEDEVRRDLDVDREAHRAGEEEARLGADRRAADGDPVGAHLDQVHVVAGGAEALLGDLDPALGGDHRRVHVVDGLVDAALEDAVQRGDGEQARVVLGERPVRGDGDALRPGALELDREPAELGGERDERAEHLQVGGVDDRDVDRVRDEAALERGDDLLGDDHAGAVLRLVGGGGEVRRDDDLVELEQRAGVRLGGEDVERGAGELAASGSRRRAPPRRGARRGRR